jgi:thioredoxin reductase
MARERADVLVVGAGPAGLSAALELKHLGVRDVMVVDREAEAGGIPRLCHHTGFGLRDLRRVCSGPAYARAYTRLAADHGIEIHTSTTITGWQGPGGVDYNSPRGLGRIEARAILLATGCRERPRPARLVPGTRPQGIFTTGSLQRFVDEHDLPVGNRAVIVGAELVSLSALMTLAQAGVYVVMMVTKLQAHQIHFPFTPLKWLMMHTVTRTPLRTSSRVRRILGLKRVEGVEVSRLDTGETDTIACDTVVFTGDWIPEHELARLGGLALDSGTGGPQVDDRFHTSERGVFAAGNLLRGAETADISALEGKKAASTIYTFLDGRLWPERALELQVAPPIKWVVPNSISFPTQQPTSSHFSFRVSKFERNVYLLVSQGDRTLYTRPFRRLMPNRSVRFASHWVSTVDPEGMPIMVTLA